MASFRTLSALLLLALANLGCVFSCSCISRDPEEWWIFWSGAPVTTDSKWGPYDDYECRGDFDFVVKAEVIKYVHQHRQGEEEPAPPEIQLPDAMYNVNIQDVFKSTKKFDVVPDKSRVYVGRTQSSCDVKLRENEEYLLRGHVRGGRLLLPGFCSFGKPWGLVKSKRQEYLREEGCDGRKEVRN